MVCGHLSEQIDESFARPSEECGVMFRRWEFCFQREGEERAQNKDRGRLESSLN
jgi:hypothetical protein